MSYTLSWTQTIEEGGQYKMTNEPFIPFESVHIVNDHENQTTCLYPTSTITKGKTKNKKKHKKDSSQKSLQ